MDRRTYIEGIGTVVAAGAVAGCTGNGDGTTDGGNGDGDGNGTGDGSDDGSSDGETEYGILSTSVTDQPNDIGDFESLVVTLDGIWVKPAGADEEEDDDGDENEADGDDETTPEDGDETPEEATPEDETTPEGTDDDADDGEDGDGETDEEDDDDEEEDDGDSGRRYIEFEEPQEADLVQLQDGETELVDETELEVDEYQFLQLDVSGTTGTLTDGGEAVVETPGNAPLKFNQAFEIRPGETTRFIADFAPFQRGNGEYLVRPVASGTQVIYGDGDGSDESTETDDGVETETDPETPGDEGATDTEDGSDGNSTATPAN